MQLFAKRVRLSFCSKPRTSVSSADEALITRSAICLKFIGIPQPSHCGNARGMRHVRCPWFALVLLYHNWAFPRAASGGYFRLRHKRSEEHTSELQSHSDLVCRLLLEKKNK